MMKTYSYWVIEANKGEIRESNLKEEKDYSLVKTLLSGISTGTEKLVGKRNVPSSAYNFMSVPYMEGNFDLPIKYGYSLVGVPLSGKYKGLRTFIMHPHQTLFYASDSDLLVLPDEISNEAAILIPYLETALNAIWDAKLRQKESVAIVGGGNLGIFVGFVLKSMDIKFSLIEKSYKRYRKILNLKWITSTYKESSDLGQTFDVIFNTSGSSEGLQKSLDIGGFESRVIDLSWYGSTNVNLNLGESFHWNRKKIISSQVSHIAAPKRISVSKDERLKQVLDLLRDPVLNKFGRCEIEFKNLPGFMHQLYANKDVGWSPIIHYERNS